MGDYMDGISKIKNKLDVKIAGALFLGLLVILMFLSRTIYNHNLPTVTAASPSSGNLNKYEATFGIVNWANVEEIYSEVGGTVEEVLISEGEKITKGQSLFRLSYNEDDVNNKLKEIEINKNKAYVDIENLELKISETENIISDPASAGDLVKISNQIDKIEGQIKRSEDDYSKLEVLYDEGAISKKDLDNSKSALENLKYDLQGLENDYKNLYEDYKNNLITLEQNLKLKNFDLDNLIDQEEIYKKALSDYENNAVIVAPKDATVISIPVKTGQYINSNQLIISFGVGNEYELECDITMDNNFIIAGDTCELVNTSHVLDGVVTKVSPGENSKKVAISFSSDEVTDGETFDVEFSKESTTTYTLVPNGAVNKDSDGYFIYQIKKRKGMLGDEFYVKKVPVYIGDSDNENTAVTKGIDFFEPIVLFSDKPFSDAETVKVENVGDFFAE